MHGSPFGDMFPAKGSFKQQGVQIRPPSDTMYHPIRKESQQ
jgi:hypothetical protein